MGSEMCIRDRDGFIITGSKSSAYDDKQWIRDLEALIQKLHARRKKMVGIYFGHQIIAKALGGVVSKSDKGWGVGIHTYELNKAPFDGAQSGQLKLVVSHQDQVHELPPGARNIVSNAHCENAGFVIGDHIFTPFRDTPSSSTSTRRRLCHFATT